MTPRKRARTSTQPDPRPYAPNFDTGEMWATYEGFMARTNVPFRIIDWDILKHLKIDDAVEKLINVGT